LYIGIPYTYIEFLLILLSKIIMMLTVFLFLAVATVKSMPIDILELEGKTFNFAEEKFNVSSPVEAFSTGTQYGLDVSTTISASSASCFVSAGYQFVVPRV
jgi:hypothetical protein